MWKWVIYIDCHVIVLQDVFCENKLTIDCEYIIQSLALEKLVHSTYVNVCRLPDMQILMWSALITFCGNKMFSDIDVLVY